MSKDVDVLTETVIRRPVAEVAAFAGDAGEHYVTDLYGISLRQPQPWDLVGRTLG